MTTTLPEATPPEAAAAPRLLVVEDDEAFARTLRRSLERRGYEVRAATTLDEVHALLTEWSPAYAVVDLKLAAGSSGLAAVQALHAHDASMLIVVLTGYASIATAVEAIKRGAHDYLAKPVDADAVVRALTEEDSDDETSAHAPDAPPPLKRLEWEHIQRVLTECEGNISEAARRLGMHRRTLARKLGKQRVR